jgi:Holliday junction DNA helicase RuvA
MIAFIKGKVHAKGRGFVIVETGGLGYKVNVSSVIFADLDIGRECELYTHQYVREDALDLYGFRSLEELELFELLLSISGIGPKSALGVLAVSSVRDIKESIGRGDSSMLTKVSGIGRKTAERVILELREKVGYLAGSHDAAYAGGAAGSAMEIDALMALGYSLPEAREALNKIDPAVTDSGERIKAALKGLGK